MKLLAQHQRVFTWLRIFPFAQGTDRKTLRLSSAFSVSVFLIQVIPFTSSILYMCENVSNYQSYPGNSLYPIIQIAGNGCTLYSLVVAYIIRDRIRNMFDKIQEIYDESSEEMKGLLDKVNRKNERVIEISLKYCPFGFSVYLAVIGIVNVIYCYLRYGYVSADRLYYPARYALPWNQETVFGWAVMLILMMLCSMAYFFLNTVFLLLFASICNFHDAFKIKSKRLLCQLDDLINVKHSAKLKTIPLLFCQIMKNNNNGKKFFKQVANVYSSFLLIQMVFDVTFLAGIIFQMDLAVKNPNMNFGTPLIALICGLLNLFVYCYIAYQSTEHYLNVADLMYKSMWNELPTKYQKYFILMIQDAQRPILYHGFKLIKINLGTFTRILKAAYTYYMMLKTITENRK